MINDLFHYWGSDVSTGPTGDLQTVNGTLLGQQRVLRRLLTNPGDYVFQPNYGAGLPAYVGQPMDVGKITALIKAHLLLESAVAKTPPPQITVTQAPTDPSALAVTIAYNDAATNTPVVLSFNVSN